MGQDAQLAVHDGPDTEAAIRSVYEGRETDLHELAWKLALLDGKAVWDVRIERQAYGLCRDPVLAVAATELADRMLEERRSGKRKYDKPLAYLQKAATLRADELRWAAVETELEEWQSRKPLRLPVYGYDPRR